MGYKDVDAVIESNLKNPVKAVAAALAKHVNTKSGSKEIWPGTKTLELYSGCSRSTVQRCVATLEQGESPILELLSEGWGGATSRYLFHTDRLVVAERHQHQRATTSSVGELPPWVEVVSESYHGSSGEAPGVVSESYPNREENLESNQEEKSNQEAEAATDPAAAAVPDENLSNPETPEWVLTPEEELLDHFYGCKLDQNLADMNPDSTRIKTDLPLIQELLFAVGGDVKQGHALISFVVTDPGNGKWDGWDKKTPDVPALIKHIHKGYLLAQFRKEQEESAKGKKGKRSTNPAHPVEDNFILEDGPPVPKTPTVPPAPPEPVMCVDCEMKLPVNGFRCEGCLADFQREFAETFRTPKERAAMRA